MPFTAQTRTLVACIIGSGIAFLDSTVVNVALPAIRRDQQHRAQREQIGLDDPLLRG